MTGQERRALKLLIDADPELRRALRGLIDEARRIREGKLRTGRELYCVGCGADYNSCTKGCRPCSERRSSRLRRGYALVRLCLGCGGNRNDLNPGCSTCRERWKGRGFGRNGDYRVAA